MLLIVHPQPTSNIGQNFSGAETFQGAVVKEEGQPPPPPPRPPSLLCSNAPLADPVMDYGDAAATAV